MRREEALETRLKLVDTVGQASGPKRRRGGWPGMSGGWARVATALGSLPARQLIPDAEPVSGASRRDGYPPGAFDLGLRLDDDAVASPESP